MEKFRNLSPLMNWFNNHLTSTPTGYSCYYSFLNLGWLQTYQTTRSVFRQDVLVCYVFRQESILPTKAEKIRRKIDPSSHFHSKKNPENLILQSAQNNSKKVTFEISTFGNQRLVWAMWTEIFQIHFSNIKPYGH